MHSRPAPAPAAACRQDLPADQAGWPSQIFAILVAVFGLASFALVLALIEQVRRRLGVAFMTTVGRSAALLQCDAPH